MRSNQKDDNGHPTADDSDDGVGEKDGEREKMYKENRDPSDQCTTG